MLWGSKNHFRSRRHLHSAFWSHGAGNIDLPPWWMLFLQYSDSAQRSCLGRRRKPATAAVSNGLQGIFLDFLYPVHALAFIRRLERSTNAQHRATQNVKQCSRRYTSITADFINGVKAIRTAPRAQARDASTSSSPETPQPGDAIRRRITEMLDSKDPILIYDELWQSYQALLEMSQSLSPQELIRMLRCLASSKRTTDIERIVALFETIPVQQRRAKHYHYTVLAALSLDDLDTAIDIHREALTKVGGSIGTAALLRYTVQHEQWQTAIDTWHPYWVNRLPYYAGSDIWAELTALSLSELMEKATLAADFAISIAESSQDEVVIAARDFATELTKQAFCIQNTNFDIDSHWRLVKKAEALDSSDMTTQMMGLKQLLSVDSREHGHRALHLYRILRKEPTFAPSWNLLSSVTDRLRAVESIPGLFEIMEDWRLHYQEIPASVALAIASVFSKLGQLEPLQSLFREVCSTHGVPRGDAWEGCAWFCELLFVHNRRADPEGVVRSFNDLQKDFHFRPTLRALNSVIGTFSRIGDVESALSWFNRIREFDLRPDFRSYFNIMIMCAKRGDWETVQEFYQQSRMDGIKPTMMMIDSVVLANINDQRLKEAEQLVEEAVHMDIEGSRTFMWTGLLNAYALRKDVAKVSQLHRKMQELGIASNGMTYAALMTSLTVAKLPEAADKILSRIMPRAKIKVLSLHYALVMGGYLAVKKYGKVIQVYKRMVIRGLSPTMSTQSMLLRAAASLDKVNQGPVKDAALQTELVRASQVFEQTISSLDPMELAPTEPRKFVGPHPLNEAFISTYFEYLIFLYGRDAAFAKVKELYERYISTAAKFGNRDVEASPPIRLLSALMVAHLSAVDHEEVQRCWYLALDKSEKLACRPRALTSEPGWVLHSRRFIINLPLRQYIYSLGRQGRIDDLINTINQLQSSGYALNSPNLNLYIQYLAQSPEPRYQLLAFELCESELMPSWRGWNTIAHPNYMTKKYRRLTEATLRVPGRKMVAYQTLVHLAAVYLQARQGIRLTPPRTFVKVAPMTVDALTSMPNVAENYQITLLRGE